MAAREMTENTSNMLDYEKRNETESMGDDYDEHKEIVPIVPYLCTIYFILIFGLIGNVLVFVLMQHPWYRRMSYSVYLRFLAVCDTVVLLIAGSEDIMEGQFNVKNFQILQVCIPWELLRIVSRFASPWLIVALTLDRFVALVIPLKRSTFCSLKVASVISAGIILLATIMTAVMVAHFKSFEEDNKIQCYPDENPALFIYYNIINAFLQSTFPCFLILVFNMVTIVAIKRGHKFRQSFTERDGENRKPALDKVTISLIAVSLAAFIMLVPLAIFEVLELVWEQEREEYENALDEAQAMNLTGDDIPEPYQNTYDVWPLLNLIHLVNFAQNFYVMIITGERYRKALRSYKCVNCLCSRMCDTYRSILISSSTQQVNISDENAIQ